MIHWRLHGRRKRRIFRDPVDARYAMNPLARKAPLFARFSLLPGRETSYLGRPNDHPASWGHAPGSCDALFLFGLLALNTGPSGCREQCPGLAGALR